MRSIIKAFNSLFGVIRYLAHKELNLINKLNLNLNLSGSLCLLRGTLCNFFHYTENHRVDTEFHRDNSKLENSVTPLLRNFCLTSILAVIFLLSVDFSIAEDKKIEIGIDEQLGAKLPLNLSFNDEQGNKVILKDLLTKPTVLAFVYYECPGICTPLMTSLAEVVNKVNLKPGEQYNIVTISMDEFETPKLAAKKKVNYMKIIEVGFPDQSWKFLTGDSLSIKKITDAAGFYFKREGDQFIHSGALIFVSAEGKICRYLFPNYTDKYGYSILPFDFKMAIMETARGVESPTVARFLQFCFSYDPEGKTYVLNFTRIFGVGIVLFAVIFVLYLKVKPKKEKSKV